MIFVLEKLIDKRNDIINMIEELAKIKRLEPDTVNAGLETLNTSTIQEKLRMWCSGVQNRTVQIQIYQSEIHDTF